MVSCFDEFPSTGTQCGGSHLEHLVAMRGCVCCCVGKHAHDADVLGSVLMPFVEDGSLLAAIHCTLRWSAMRNKPLSWRQLGIRQGLLLEPSLFQRNAGQRQLGARQGLLFEPSVFFHGMQVGGNLESFKVRCGRGHPSSPEEEVGPWMVSMASSHNACLSQLSHLLTCSSEGIAISMTHLYHQPGSGVLVGSLTQ
eukprot:scaffold227257_cov17-Tisochrysis_lutea.AAC.1